MSLNILQINTTDQKGGAAKVAYRLKNGLKKLKQKSLDLIVLQKVTNKSRNIKSRRFFLIGKSR